MAVSKFLRQPYCPLRKFHKKFRKATEKGKMNLILVAMISHDYFYRELPLYLNPDLLKKDRKNFVRAVRNRLQQTDKAIFISLLNRPAVKDNGNKRWRQIHQCKFNSWTTGVPVRRVAWDNKTSKSNIYGVRGLQWSQQSQK